MNANPVTHPHEIALECEQDHAPPGIRKVVRKWRPVGLESEVLEILQRHPEPGERIEMAFRRKESDLVSCFGRLSVGEALELHRRLRLGFQDDEIAERFGRLVADRRQRLLAYLADARRREALNMWQQRL